LAAFLRGRSLRVLATAGLWLAAATFVRPVTYYLPVALALGLFLVLGARARLNAGRRRGAADQRAPVAGRMADSQLGRDGLRRFSSISMSTCISYAPDVAARVEHRSYTDMRNELGYWLRAGLRRTLLSLSALSRVPSEQSRMEPGATPGIHAFIGSQCYPGALRGYLRLCFSHLLVAPLQPRTGGFQEPAVT